MVDPCAIAAKAFYGELLRLLHDARLPVLVGGSYAFSQLTGIERQTKDLDLFIRRADWPRLAALAQAAGWRADLLYPHWLGKVHHAPHFADTVFCSGNGLSPVDDEWFVHAHSAELFGQRVQVVPAEENLWTKAFIMERERFDGADVAHLLKACAGTLDWQRLLQRFGAHWRVLLAHLVLFGFIYPDERDAIPPALIDELLARMRTEPAPALDSTPRVCAGTLLSREQYLSDVLHDGCIDARLLGDHAMSTADIAQWTAAIATPPDAVDSLPGAAAAPAPSTSTLR